ncbi:MAG: hypothetical protein AAB821_00730 [Patescibacteria group bacterium]
MTSFKEKSMFLAIFLSILIGTMLSLAVTMQFQLGLWVLIPGIPLFGGLAYVLYDVRATALAIRQAACDTWQCIATTTRDQMNHMLAWWLNWENTKIRLLALAVLVVAVAVLIITMVGLFVVSPTSIDPNHSSSLLFMTIELLGCLTALASLGDVVTKTEEIRKKGDGFRSLYFKIFLGVNVWLVLIGGSIYATYKSAQFIASMMPRIIRAVSTVIRLTTYFGRRLLYHLYCEERRICFVATALGLTGGVVHGYVYDMILPSAILFALIGGSAGVVGYRLLGRRIAGWTV